MGAADISTNFALFTAAQDMTATTTVTSNPINLERAGGVSVQVVWAGTPAGNFKLQCSDDLGKYDGETVTGVTNWTDVASSTVAAGGAAGSTMYSVDRPHYRWLRLNYTNTSSTGTFNARVNK